MNTSRLSTLDAKFFIKKRVLSSARIDLNLCKLFLHLIKISNNVVSCLFLI